MTLIVHALGHYRSYAGDLEDAPWTDGELTMLRLIKALKGQPFTGSGHITRRAGPAFTWSHGDTIGAFNAFGYWGARCLGRLQVATASLVPVPSSGHVTFGATFQPLLLANAVAAASGNGVAVSPALAWKQPMQKSHQGGGRNEQTLLAGLKLDPSQLTLDEIVLVDDVCSKGAHFRACATFLRERGYTIRYALCAGRTSNAQQPSFLKVDPEDIDPAPDDVGF